MAAAPIEISYNENLKPLEALLAEVKRTGDFHVSGTAEIPMPRVEIEGVGVISFPVPPEQAAAVIAQASRAPYGRGEATIVDTAVRKVWQLTPDRVRVGGKSWDANFAAIMTRVAAGLGCDAAAVAAELYKLLVYDEGGFFVAHRDTEKAAGMFGTLVLALPSAHRGGELVIRHAGREAVVELSRAENSEVAFAAFYADCEHEVRPIAAGHRVCLVYNLIQKPTAKSGQALLAPDYAAQTTMAATLLEQALTAPDAPTKIAWLLDHHYSPDALSFAALKGQDLARAGVLAGAAEKAACVVHLGIVHIEESGAAEPTYDPDAGRRGRRYYGRYADPGDEGDIEEDASSDDFEIVEVSDARQFVDGWRDRDDRAVGFGALPLEEGELLPSGALDGEMPDEQRLTEATGNAGAGFERLYRRAALVLWRSDRYVDVLLQSGVAAVLPYFEERVAAATATADASESRAEAIALGRRLIEEWSDAPRYRDYRQPERKDTLSAMLDLLARLGDAALIEEFIATVVTDGYDGSENAALLAGVRRLDAPKAGALLGAIVDARMEFLPEACAGLLHVLVADRMAADLRGWKPALEALAARVVAGFGKLGEPRADDADVFDRFAAPPQTIATPTLVAAILRALEMLTADGLRAAAARAVIARPGVFDPVAVVVPALATVHAAAPGRELLRDGANLALWVHGARFLLERSEFPPEPPKDWRQDVKVSCTCADCRELQVFVRDPIAQVHRFRVRQDRRQHLHGQIQRDGLDMTHVTERIGSPQTLVCTKDRRSFARRGRQYRDELAAMGALQEMAGASLPGDAAALAPRLAAARARAMG